MDNNLDFKLLKRLYSIHSPSGKEGKMIKFIANYLKTIPGVEFARDAYGNLYARKGVAVSYPCLVAHTDQVQKHYPADFRAIETRDIIFGYSPSEQAFCGLGSDDKNGILICLEALKKYDCVKAVFFREEEIGCIGSSKCEMSFFDDCRFVLQCDRRGNSDFITSIGFTDLCSEDFIHAVDPERWGYKEANGMMTDVEALKGRGLKVSACNISCGYYNPHSDNELTVKRDLQKCWRFVQHIIESCADIYPHEPDPLYSFGYTEWELEEDLYNILQQDPTLTAADIYDMYHTNFPRLTRDDFERIVQEYKDFYTYDEEGY